jgi:hypothetical protein
VRIQRRKVNTGPPTPRHAEHWHIPHEYGTYYSPAFYSVRYFFSKNTDSQRNHRYTRGNDRLTDSDSCRIISRRRTQPSRQHHRIWPERGRTDQYDSCFHFVLARRHPSLLRCGSLKHERKGRRALNRLWSSISIRISPERGAAQISRPVPSPSSQWEVESGRR